MIQMTSLIGNGRRCYQDVDKIHSFPNSFFPYYILHPRKNSVFCLTHWELLNFPIGLALLPSAGDADICESQNCLLIQIQLIVSIWGPFIDGESR